LNCSMNSCASELSGRCDGATIMKSVCIGGSTSGFLRCPRRTGRTELLRHLDRDHRYRGRRGPPAAGKADRPRRRGAVDRRRLAARSPRPRGRTTARFPPPSPPSTGRRSSAARSAQAQLTLTMPSYNLIRHTQAALGVPMTASRSPGLPAGSLTPAPTLNMPAQSAKK
jgi:hypothetical protein